jgi:hypothetical protein
VSEAVHAIERGVRDDLVPAVRGVAETVERALCSVARGIKAVAERVEATEAYLCGKLAQIGNGSGSGSGNNNGYGDGSSYANSGSGGIASIGLNIAASFAGWPASSAGSDQDSTRLNELNRAERGVVGSLHVNRLPDAERP